MICNHKHALMIRLGVVILGFCILQGCELKSVGLEGIQLNQMVQSDSQKAQAALASANEATCEAAASHRSKAQALAVQTATIAAKSQATSQRISDGWDQCGEIQSFMADAQRRIDERSEAQREAREAFQNQIDLGDMSRLGPYTQTMSAYANTSRELARAYVTAADDLKLLLQTNPDRLKSFLPNGSTLAADAQAFSDKANEVLTKTIDISNTTYTVPNEPDLRMGDFAPSGPVITHGPRAEQYKELKRLSALVDGTGFTLERDYEGSTLNMWQGLQATLQGTVDSIQAGSAGLSKDIAEFAKQTQQFSTEAARHAWLARQVCGMEVPENLPDLTNPFDNYHNPYPDWNSTFWDFSSP